jgi:hypothetical protein
MSEQEMTPATEEEDFIEELSDEALDRTEGAQFTRPSRAGR